MWKKMSVKCEICDKLFSKQYNLNKHLGRVHNQTDRNIVHFENDVYIHKCLECRISFRILNDLRYHLESVHQMNMQMEEHEFCTRSEFLKWYENVCISENIQYTHNIKNNNKEYFNCNRSGKISSKDSSRRAGKRQGSCKLNYSCTSQIVVQINKKKVSATYYKTHYGHSNDVQHLRLYEKDKIAIATKLSNGISMKRLLEDTRGDIPGNQIKRIHLLTKKDLRNVKTAYNLETDEGHRNANACVSIETWVQEQKNSANNSVLFYKERGAQMEGFRVEDFCLIIVNPSQKKLLQQYGANIITIDSTHGLTTYDFDLTTVMVLDDHGEGLPAACMFSNRQDTYIFEVFFSMIKKEVGIVSTSTFMSDITDTFYKAWTKTMDTPEHKLFCSWHVERDWQVHIDKIKNPEKKIWVYQTVNVLQTTIDKDEFKNLLESYAKLFLRDKDTEQFGRYFNHYYYNNTRAWAYCYRKKCGLTSNMHVESMHKVVKYFYLEGKKVQQLDKDFNAIINFIQNKIVERIIKNAKGESSQRITKRHRLSLALNYNIDVTDINGTTYKIIDENNCYIVTKILQKSCCKIKCIDCKICVHCFSCECVDYNIEHTICKHIHYIVVNFYNNEKKQTVEVDMDPLVETSVHSATSSKKKTMDVQKQSTSVIKDNILDQLQILRQEMITFFHEGDHSSLCQIYNKLEETKSLVVTLKSCEKIQYHLNNQCILQEPDANKKIEKQVTFENVKCNVKSVLPKPNKEEVRCIKSIMLC